MSFTDFTSVLAHRFQCSPLLLLSRITTVLALFAPPPVGLAPLVTPSHHHRHQTGGVAQVSQAQTLCRLGLLPELGRAWLTVDSDLFVWLYETGGDLAYFDGLSEAILAVGMVAPRPGVFQRHVSALLCLATCSEIVILGVALLNQGQGQATAGSGGQSVARLPLALSLCGRNDTRATRARRRRPLSGMSFDLYLGYKRYTSV